MNVFKKLFYKTLFKVTPKKPELTVNLTNARIAKLVTKFSAKEINQRDSHNNWPEQYIRWDRHNIGTFNVDFANWLADHEHVMVPMDLKRLKLEELMDIPDSSYVRYWSIRFIKAESMALYKLRWEN